MYPNNNGNTRGFNHYWLLNVVKNAFNSQRIIFREEKNIFGKILNLLNLAYTNLH